MNGVHPSGPRSATHPRPPPLRRVKPTSIPSPVLSTFDTNPAIFATASTHGDIPSTKIIAARISPQTIDDLAERCVDVVSQKFWLNLNHIVFRALTINSEGKLDMMCPTMYFPKLCLESVKAIESRWDHLKLVWGMFDYHEDYKVFKLVRSQPQIFLDSLRAIVKNFEIKVMEIDVMVLAAVFHLPNAQEELANCGCKFWLTIGNNGQPQEIQDLYVKCFDFIEVVVIKSFGFQRYNDHQSTHGTFYSMQPSPESAHKYFVDRVESMEFPGAKILMEIDTCGVEYRVSENDNDVARSMRIINRREIHKLLLLGEVNVVCRYNAHDGASMISVPGKKLAISHDNEQVIRKKFNYVRENHLGGVLLGEMQDDLFPNHRDSLFNSSTLSLLG